MNGKKTIPPLTIHKYRIQRVPNKFFTFPVTLDIDINDDFTSPTNSKQILSSSLKVIKKKKKNKHLRFKKPFLTFFVRRAPELST